MLLMGRAGGVCASVHLPGQTQRKHHELGILILNPAYFLRRAQEPGFSCPKASQGPSVLHTGDRENCSVSRTPHLGGHAEPGSENGGGRKLIGAWRPC